RGLRDLLRLGTCRHSPTSGATSGAVTRSCAICGVWLRLTGRRQGGSLIGTVTASRLGAVIALCIVSGCGGVDKNGDDNTPPTAPGGLQATAPDPQHVQ